MTDTDVPSRLFVGITGHRKLDNPDAIRSVIRDELDSQLTELESSTSSPVIPSLLTALAEGADRLAADATLSRNQGEVHAVLPLSPIEYESTFSSADARGELDTYLDQALTTTVQPDRDDTPGAYLDVGKSIVDTCDILFAVWDGDSAAGTGGTADIVNYARRHQKPLIWINPSNPSQPIHENMESFSLPHLETVEAFNRLPFNRDATDQYCESQLATFTGIEAFDTTELKGIDDVHARFSEIFTAHCPVYRKADRNSVANQRRFKAATFLIYALAAFAVGVISVQTLFFSGSPEIVLLESGAMLSILIIIYLSARNQWHENWLKYRTLAEQIRSRMFVGLATRSAGPYSGPSPVDGRQIRNRWVTDILVETWAQTSSKDNQSSVDIETLKSFIRTHWVEDQIDYHRENRDRSQWRNTLLSTGGQVVFLVTLIASVIHAVELTGHSYTSYILLISFFLPSIGGSLGAIRMSQDYETEALRSERILQQLRGLDYQLDYVNDPESLVEWTREVEKILEIEHHNWRNIHEGKPLEPAA